MYLSTDKYKYYSRHSKKKKQRLLLFFVIVGIAALVVISLVVLLPLRGGNLNSGRLDIYDAWNAGMYGEVSTLSEKMLSQNPLNPTALMFYGFARYYLAFYEKALEEKIPLLDDAIIALRRAVLAGQNEYSAQINYILGQAYLHKGKFYYDLLIRYIEKSLEEGYTGNDAYEYLGLAYGGLGNTEKELHYFLRASEKRSSDLILLSVGKAYFKNNDHDSSEDYLLRSINKTSDPNIEKESRYILAEIYTQREDLLKAEDQYRAIIEIDRGSAKAHFQLGEIYYSMNDIVRARAQWRRTLTIDPSHRGAKLRYYD
jgi:tetratricopeptide (TPR) repeat protein